MKKEFYVDDKGNCILTPKKANNILANILLTGIVLCVGATLLSEIRRHQP